MRRVALALLIGCMAMAARKDREASALPAWLAERIETFKREPVADPPRSVYRYTYKGKTVYLIPGEGCCDQYDELYDASGGILCAPSGGKSGSGDRRTGLSPWDRQKRMRCRWRPGSESRDGMSISVGGSMCAKVGQAARR